MIGLQYTPVDSMATVRIRHCCSQSASAFRSSVKLAKERTGSVSRSGGTATYISVGPISLPAASAFSAGSPTVAFLLFLLRAISPSAMRLPGPAVRVVDSCTLPNGIDSRAFAGSSIVTTVLTTQLGATLEERAQESTTAKTAYLPSTPAIHCRAWFLP